MNIPWGNAAAILASEPKIRATSAPATADEVARRARRELVRRERRRSERGVSRKEIECSDSESSADSTSEPSDGYSASEYDSNDQSIVEYSDSDSDAPADRPRRGRRQNAADATAEAAAAAEDALAASAARHWPLSLARLPFLIPPPDTLVTYLSTADCVPPTEELGYIKRLLDSARNTDQVVAVAKVLVERWLDLWKELSRLDTDVLYPAARTTRAAAVARGLLVASQRAPEGVAEVFAHHLAVVRRAAAAAPSALPSVASVMLLSVSRQVWSTGAPRTAALVLGCELAARAKVPSTVQEATTLLLLADVLISLAGKHVCPEALKLLSNVGGALAGEEAPLGLSTQWVAPPRPKLAHDDDSDDEGELAPPPAGCLDIESCSQARPADPRPGLVAGARRAVLAAIRQWGHDEIFRNTVIDMFGDQFWGKQVFSALRKCAGKTQGKKLRN